MTSKVGDELLSTVEHVSKKTKITFFSQLKGYFIARKLLFLKNWAAYAVERCKYY